MNGLQELGKAKREGKNRVHLAHPVFSVFPILFSHFVFMIMYTKIFSLKLLLPALWSKTSSSPE